MHSGGLFVCLLLFCCCCCFLFLFFNVALNCFSRLSFMQFSVKSTARCSFLSWEPSRCSLPTSQWVCYKKWKMEWKVQYQHAERCVLWCQFNNNTLKGVDSGDSSITTRWKVCTLVTECIVCVQGYDPLTFSFLTSFLFFDWVGVLWF